MSDLRERLEESVQGLDPSWRHPDEVRRSLDRRRRRARIRAGAVAGAIAIAIVLVSVWALTANQNRRPPAQTPSPSVVTPSFDPLAYGTYLIGDVRIIRHIRIVGSASAPPPTPRDPHLVMVLWKSAWSTDQYPGVHGCRVSVVDGSGNEIGGVSLRYQNATPRASWRADVPIAGTVADAADADVMCDPKRVDPPVGFDVSGEPVVRVRRLGGRPLLVEVEAFLTLPVGLDLPGLKLTLFASCRTVLSLPSGKEVASLVSHTVVTVGPSGELPPGPTKFALTRQQFSSPSVMGSAALSADITCRPWAGREKGA